MEMLRRRRGGRGAYLYGASHELKFDRVEEISPSLVSSLPRLSFLKQLLASPVPPPPHVFLFNEHT
jgi:hypothetical protein